MIVSKGTGELISNHFAVLGSEKEMFLLISKFSTKANNTFEHTC